MVAVVGLKQQNAIARIEQSLQGRGECAGRTVGDDNLRLRVGGDAIIPQQFAGDGLP